MAVLRPTDEARVGPVQLARRSRTDIVAPWIAAATEWNILIRAST